ncbi:MAG: response regulator [Devosia sp.]|jgi:CheY-like chemotaxis protein|nr:response regulator [Devosia sp.]
MTFHSCTRILIVEDDAITASMMEAIIEDLGYQVVGPSTQFEAALAAARSDDLDFALLDFNLGHGQDVGPIAKILAGRGVPFAFTTGLPPAVIREAFEHTPIISKPVVEEELLDLLP